MTADPHLVPELAVTDCTASVRFWCDLLGFTVLYERPEEGFAYLTCGGAHVMLDQIDVGRTWRTGDEEGGVREFLVQDPDGYLVRLQMSLGRRAARERT